MSISTYPRKNILCNRLSPIFRYHSTPYNDRRDCTKGEYIRLKATLRRLCAIMGWNFPDCMKNDSGGLASLYLAIKELSVDYFPEDCSRVLHIVLDSNNEYRLCIFKEAISYASPMFFYYNSFKDTCSPSFVRLYRRFTAAFVRSNSLCLAHYLPWLDYARGEMDDRLAMVKKSHRGNESPSEIRNYYSFIRKYDGSWGNTLDRLMDSEKNNPFSSKELLSYNPKNDTENRMVASMADALPALSPTIPLMNCSMAGSVNAILQGETEDFLIDCDTLVGLAYDSEDGYMDYISNECEYKCNYSYYTRTNPLGIPAVLSPDMDEIVYDVSTETACDFINNVI